MSSKKIYHISDLPAWFSLENYKATESLGVSDWAYFLERRFIVDWLLNDPNESEPNLGKTMFSDMLRDNSDMSKDSSEEESSRSKARRDMDRMSKEDDICHNPGFRHGFNSGSLGFIDHMTSAWAWYMAKEVEDLYGVDENEDLNTSTFIIEHNKNTESIDLAIVPMLVDLKGSDEDLKKEFDRFLQSSRAFTGIKNKKTHITESDVDKLQRYRILPYADLQLWGHINNTTISAKTILNALFSDNEDILSVGEPFISQTLKPFYKKVMSVDFIYALDHFVEK